MGRRPLILGQDAWNINMFCSLLLLLYLLHASAATASRGNTTLSNNTLSQSERWRNAVEKGHKLYDLLQSGQYPDKPNPPTVKDLLDMSWSVFPRKPKPVGLQDLQPQLSTRLVRAIDATPEKDYYDQDLHYAGTNYDAVYSPRNGLIAAQNSRRHHSSHLHWSDAVFALWQWLCEKPSTDLASLKYIAQCGIANGATLEILIDIEALSQTKRPRMIQIKPDDPKTSEWFFAIMGTPNAVGVVYLIMEHKALLGVKSIPNIKLFFYRDGIDPGWSPDILFEAADFDPATSTTSCTNNRTANALNSCMFS